jgi:hypothetical protein
MTADVFLELDSRRRAPLARLARDRDTQFLASVDEDGTIHLTPAVVLPAYEARLRSRPELVGRLEASVEDGDTMGSMSLDDL